MNRDLGAIVVMGVVLSGAIAYGVRDLSTHRELPPGIARLAENAGWCWFQGPRALWTPDGRLVFGSVAGGDGREAGDVVVVAYDPRSASSERTVLHARLDPDDHAAPSLHVRADGRFLATYTTHDRDGLVRSRVTEAAGVLRDWSPELHVDLGARVTYTNLARTSDGKLWNFVRGPDGMPRVLLSEDDGSSWRTYGALFAGRDRPYVKVVASGSRVHVVATDAHPRAGPSGVYYGYLEGGSLHDGAGHVVDADLSDGKAADPTALTRIFAAGPDEVPWIADAVVDAEGSPRIVLTVRGAREEAGYHAHRYVYVARSGSDWSSVDLAHAGRELYADETDYSGLAAVDPRDPSHVVISTDVDPVTKRPLESGASPRRHWELYRGRSADGGLSWTWTPLTSRSGVDNMRPVFPQSRDGGEPPVVLWLRGSYRSYRSYDLDVVAHFGP